MTVVWNANNVTVTVQGQSGTIAYGGQSTTISTGVLGTPTGAAGGDLTGTYPNPVVHQVHGKNFQSGQPNDGEVWSFKGSADQWQHLSAAQAGLVAETDARLTDARTPTGAAGGSLSGTYPNPSIGANAVGTTQIANGAVTLAKMANMTSARLLGNFTGTTAAPMEVTVTSPLTVNTGTGALGWTVPSTLTTDTISQTAGEVMTNCEFFLRQRGATSNWYWASSFVTSPKIRPFLGTNSANTSQGGGTLYPDANRVYYTPFMLTTRNAIRYVRIATTSANGGNCRIGLYSDNNGVPGTKLQETSSFAVNANWTLFDTAVNWTPPKAGWHWMACIFSASTPIISGIAFDQATGIMGYRDSSQYNRAFCFELEDAGSFALPSTASSTIAGAMQCPAVQISYIP